MPEPMSYRAMIEELQRNGEAFDVRIGSRVERSGMPTPELRRSPKGQMITAAVAAFAPVIKGFVANEIQRATAPLLARVAELEARAVPRWCGPFIEGKYYGELSFVVCSGALWVAEHATAVRPGGDNSGWRLCCKRGAYDEPR